MRGRVEALLTARAAAHLDALQVERAHENILPGERARPRRSATHSARRRALGFFAGRNDTRKYSTLESVRGRVEALLTARVAAHLASLQVEMTQENILRRERARPRSSSTHGARRRSLGFLAGRNHTRKYFLESVHCRVEALLTARAAAHLASLQVGNDARKYSTGRACAAATHSTRRRQLGFFAGR